MSDSETLQVESKGRVVVVTIHRPQALNALNRQVLVRLGDCMDRLENEPATGAVVITGSGDRSFVAGADISELSRLDPLEARRFAELGQAVFERVENFAKPVIAAINGFCLGGGCELALACHLRIAARSARIGQPEVKLGLIPGFGGTQRLTRLVGRGAALELLLTGEMIPAETAFRIGLVNRLVEADELVPQCLELAEKILANSPVAVRYCLEAVKRGAQVPLGEALALESALFGLSFASADAREGMQAFLEKRTARFTGSEGGSGEGNHG